MISLPFALFMAESEGLLDTREGKVNAMCKDIRKRALQGEVSLKLNDDYLSQFGLVDCDFTAVEWRKILRAAGND